MSPFERLNWLEYESQNSPYINANEIALYFVLFNTANRAKWPEFIAPNSQILAITLGWTKSSDRKKMKTARDNLVKAGLVSVETSTGWGAGTVFKMLDRGEIPQKEETREETHKETREETHGETHKGTHGETRGETLIYNKTDRQKDREREGKADSLSLSSFLEDDELMQKAKDQFPKRADLSEMLEEAKAFRAAKGLKLNWKAFEKWITDEKKPRFHPTDSDAVQTAMIEEVPEPINFEACKIQQYPDEHPVRRMTWAQVLAYGSGLPDSFQKWSDEYTEGEEITEEDLEEISAEFSAVLSGGIGGGAE